MSKLNKLVVIPVMVAITLLLSACGITSGTVTEKTIDEGHYVYPGICVSYNKNGVCTLHVPTWDDTDYLIRIEEDEDSNRIEISQEEYETINVGDYYTDPEGRN